MKRGILLEVRDVWKTFAGPTGRAHVLRGASLALEAETTVALIGPGGSGKTTLLRIVAGLLLPTRGVVRIPGRVVAAADRPAEMLRPTNRLGIVHELQAMEESSSVRSLLAKPLHDLGWSEEDVATRLDSILEQADLLTHADKPLSSLSTTERQWVIVWQALAPDPPIILADEPAAGGDVAARERILRTLADAGHRRGHAALLTSRSFEIVAFADRSLILEKGRIVDEARSG